MGLGTERISWVREKAARTILEETIEFEGHFGSEVDTVHGKLHGI